ncbi:MAG: hypothetical protein WC876_05905 [Candidatus Thermoplasmatota archaeon]|jgi:hypothetical protein
MASRSDMDRPATVTAAVLGLVLIGVTIPYFLFGGDAGATDYTVTWSEAEAGSADEAAGAANTDTLVEVVVTDVQPASATILFDPCTDNAQPPLSSRAQITWTLKEGDLVVASSAAPVDCNAPGPITVELGEHSDVGAATASTASDAEQQAYESEDLNKTASYTLTFRWTRPAGTLPVPVGTQNIQLGASLTIHSWRATANAADQEVPR